MSDQFLGEQRSGFLEYSTTVVVLIAIFSATSTRNECQYGAKEPRGPRLPVGVDALQNGPTVYGSTIASSVLDCSDPMMDTRQYGRTTLPGCIWSNFPAAAETKGGSASRWTSLSFPVVNSSFPGDLTVPGTSSCEMYLYTVVPC